MFRSDLIISPYNARQKSAGDRKLFYFFVCVGRIDYELHCYVQKNTIPFISCQIALIYETIADICVDSNV